MDHAAQRSPSRGAHWLHLLEWTAIGVTGAVILSPYVLPSLGIGTAPQAAQAMSILHSTVEGDGLAGFVNRGLALVPGIGPTIAGGGWATTGIAAATGIGGTLLGNLIADHGKTRKAVFIGQAIAVAGLATSMLVSLPTLLTGVSAGLLFLASVHSPEAGNFALNEFPIPHLGSVGAVGAATTGAGLVATVSRLLTCCLPSMPVGMAVMMQRHKSAHNRDAAVSLEILPSLPGEAGTTIRLRDAAGKPLGEDRLELQHEHKLHLMAIDSALGEYHHLHPVPGGRAGEYHLDFEPAAGKAYHLWADAMPLGETRSAAAQATIGDVAREPAAIVPPSHRTSADGLRFSWQASPPLRRGESSVIDIAVADAAGRPVADLEPIMGAAAHLVGFTADHSAMMHLHPLAAENGHLRFHVEPSRDGPTRFFLQVQRAGRVSTAAFGEQIYPAKSGARQRLEAAPAQHAHAR